MLIKRIYNVMMRPSRRKRQKKEEYLAYQTKMRAWASTMDATEEGKTRIVADYEYLLEKKGLTMEEYYEYKFDKRSDEFRKTFLGLNEQRFYLDYLNPVKYYIFARNKYFTHRVLEDCGVRKATLYCYYHPEGQFPGSHDTAGSLDDVMRILRQKEVQTCVIKTTESSHGDNVWVINSIEYSETDAILTRFDGEKLHLSAILGDAPLIFESVVHQTKQFESFNASSVNTVRFMTTLYPDGTARVIATFIKIGRAGKWVDNAGAGGNVDVCVDVETGEIKYAIQFDGWDSVKDIDCHPDNGNRLNGVVIENWDAIKEEVKKFQQAFPYCKAAGWDIAITDEGPLVIEVNDMWDRTGQFFIHRGWREEIRDCYMAWKATSKTYYMGRLKHTLKWDHLLRIVENDWTESQPMDAENEK